MKTIFIEAKAEMDKGIKFDVAKLPDKVALVAAVQFLDWLPKLKEFIESKGKRAVVCGQILGCDVCSTKEIASKDCRAFLYLGTGKFHPIAVALEHDKPVFALHPESMQLSQVSKADIEKIKKRRKGQLLKFHSSKEIGVLISTKPGQSTVQGKLDQIFKIQEKYKDKNFYFFLTNTLDNNELENFPFIEAWLNTMCPRIEEDLRVLNIRDLS